MHYSGIKKFDIANGVGIRVSIFVSGCRNHCINCFNRDTWNFDHGNEFDSNIQELILQYMDSPHIRGLSVLGGEPFEPENQRGLLPFLKKIKETYPNKDLWVYTGFIWESEILGNSRANCEVTGELLKLIDVLVDGRYIEEQKNISLRFRGSENQRLIDVKKTLNNGKVILWED